MTIGLLTNIISPHQLPLAKAIVAKVGKENYRYVYTEEFHAERAKMGWSDSADGIITVKLDGNSRAWLENADLVYCEERDIALFKARIARHRPIVYVSERWFRPPFGWFRLVHPCYLKRAISMARLLMSPGVKYFPQGVHAWNDMAKFCRLIGCKNPESHFTMWGYFVAPSTFPPPPPIPRTSSSLRVLWVGRLLKLKRVDTLIRAVGLAGRNIKIALTIVGSGIDKSRLERLAKKILKEVGTNVSIAFIPSVPIEQVRAYMQSNDVYVFPSDYREGWGAVVNEALEEGLMVLGSYEAGASATMLPSSHLFHSRKWRQLAELLQQVAYGKLNRVPIGEWSAEKAAERLLELA